MVSVSLVTRWRSYAAFKPGPFIPADGFIGNCWSRLPGAARRRAPDPGAGPVAVLRRLGHRNIAGRVRALAGKAVEAGKAVRAPRARGLCHRRETVSTLAGEQAPTLRFASVVSRLSSLPPLPPYRRQHPLRHIFLL